MIAYTITCLTMRHRKSLGLHKLQIKTLQGWLHRLKHKIEDHAYKGVRYKTGKRLWTQTMNLMLKSKRTLIMTLNLKMKMQVNPKMTNLMKRAKLSQADKTSMFVFPDDTTEHNKELLKEIKETDTHGTL